MDDELGNFRDDGRSEKISGKSDLQARGPCGAWKGVAAGAGEHGAGQPGGDFGGEFVTLLPLESARPLSGIQFKGRITSAAVFEFYRDFYHQANWEAV